MRILHVAAGNLFGGVERILVEIARARPASTHEFALSFEGRLARELDAAGARRYDLGEVRFSRPLSVLRARRRLRPLAASGAEIVVCHSPWAYAIAAPALRRPPILWAHDALRGTHWTERRVARRPPARVICNSEYTERSIAEWLQDATTTVIYAPVAAPVRATDRAAVRRHVGAGATALVIVLASRFERWKGHAELLRAASALQGDWEIWIAGAAQRAHERTLEAELRRLASNLGIAPRVRFLGERSDVYELFGAADIHCQPNTAPEPFGLAFVEALYAGLPVVTSDAGGAREIVTRDCGVLLPMGDVAALRGALQSLVSDPHRRATLAAAGPARARELCTPEAQVARLEGVLAGCAAAA